MAKLSEEKIQKIIQIFNDEPNLSYTAISKKIGCSATTVKKYIVLYKEKNSINILNNDFWKQDTKLPDISVLKEYFKNTEDIGVLTDKELQLRKEIL